MKRGNGHVESTPRDQQQREARTSLLKMNSNSAFLVDRHARPFPLSADQSNSGITLKPGRPVLPFRRIGESVAIRHLDLRQALRVEDLVFFDYVVLVQRNAVSA